MGAPRAGKPLHGSGASLRAKTFAKNRPDAKNEPALAQRRLTDTMYFTYRFVEKLVYFSLNEK